VRLVLSSELKTNMVRAPGLKVVAGLDESPRYALRPNCFTRAHARRDAGARLM
jgi:hypothetical protein